MRSTAQVLLVVEGDTTRAAIRPAPASSLLADTNVEPELGSFSLVPAVRVAVEVVLLTKAM